MCSESKSKKEKKREGVFLWRDYSTLAKCGFPNSRQDWTEDNRLPSHPSSVGLQENCLLLPQKRGNSQSIQEVAVPFLSSDSEPST